jgi:hypothetical protein
MPDEEFVNQPASPSAPSPANNAAAEAALPDSAAPAGPPIVPSFGEEFDRAKWTIPPGKILGIAIAIVAVALALVAFLNRARPVGVGSIDNVTVAELGDKASVLVAINVTVRNVSEKPLYIHEIQSTLTTAEGKKLSDGAASPVDFARYFQAYPALGQAAIAPLQVEAKIPPGGETKGTVVVNFAVTQADFDKRKSISVIVSPYDRRPIVLAK